MEDLLEKECIVISNERDLLRLCLKYRIPCTPTYTSFFNRDSTKYAFVISRDGVKACNDDIQPDLTVFKTIDALRFYLFQKDLFNGKIVVYKEDYRIYLKTIRILKKLGIKTIKDRTYFDDSDHFYISCGYFKELSYFSCKYITTMTKAVEFKASDFLLALKDFSKNRNEYKKHITYYQSKIGDEQ